MQSMRHMAVCLGAALLVLLASGPFPSLAFAALIWIVGFSIGYGELLPEEASESGTMASARHLPILLALLHFPVLFFVVPSIVSSPTPMAHKIALFFALSLYVGQASLPAAHELIHRTDRMSFNLGRLVLISVLFGHHASSHRLVHHRHVATPNDPNTAPKGTSIYRFLPGAWRGSWRAGLAAERNHSPTHLSAPYRIYLLGSAAFLLAFAMLGGLSVLIIYVAAALHATMQILLSDYVQHYGLQRKIRVDGSVEPVSPAHAWDAPRRGPDLLMLNAPRHASHHMRPALPYEQLTLSEDAPQLPHSLAVMGFIAFFPSWWRRVMHPRLDKMS